MNNDRKILRSETLVTVRERERERELYSNELSFVNCAKNINIIIDNIRADYMPKVVYSLSFLCAKIIKLNIKSITM